MKNKILSYLLLSVSLVFGPTIASATITTLYDDTAPQAEWLVVPVIADWATNSQKMNGMLITATFFGGGTETLVWGEDVGTGGVSGTGWDLYMQNPAGNTLSYGFTLAATGATDIISLLMEGAPGDTLFDVDPLIGANSTANSRDGVPVTDSYTDAWGNIITDSVVETGVDITASYLTPVALPGVNPVWDLYSNLLLSFTNTIPGSNAAGFTSASTLTFISDTDNIGVIPEPATMLLFGAGLVGLLGGRRFRKR